MTDIKELLRVEELSFRYFAYNCLEFKLPDGKTLLIDPCLQKDGRYACGYDVSALDGCDYVLINHTHFDHIASLGAVYERFHPQILANASVIMNLAEYFDIPFIKFIPFTAGDLFDFDSFSVKILPGRHNPAQMFNIRPSDRIDETATDKLLKEHLSNLNAEERRLENMGSVYNNNFIISLKNNMTIGFFAGNPGMLDPLDRNIWKYLRPDILFAHRAPVIYENWAGRMAQMLDITGAHILIPIHLENHFLQTVDVDDYEKKINRECQNLGITGRAILPKRAIWYGISTSFYKR